MTKSNADVPLIDLADVQGNVLRGYRATHVRHFALAVSARGDGPGFLGALVSGRADQDPQVSTASEWNEKPAYCLNLGVSAAGMTALGVSSGVLGAFPAAFSAGSAARSTVPSHASDWEVTGLGDIGSSAPDQWILGGPATPVVHLLITLSTDEARNRALEERTSQLRETMARYSIEEVASMDAAALPGARVHFGYRDGISQPAIEGVPGRRAIDLQPDARAGDFLLGNGYLNIFGGNYLGAIPAALGTNATYSAFRILRQDVEAFEAFLDRAAQRYSIDRELVAAKMMGRWRNGTPLTLSPDTATPPRAIPGSHLNAYDYAATQDHPAFFDDVEGTRCPVGAHMRRLNPRGALVMGLPHNHRIIRRGMAYGPAYGGSTDPRKDVERGLVGHFFCGDLENQFEFIMKVWANQDIAAPGLRGSRDPILGAQPEIGGKLTIRTNDTRDPVVLDDLPRLVQTRGSLYLLMPGIGGIRALAAQ